MDMLLCPSCRDMKPLLKHSTSDMYCAVFMGHDRCVNNLIGAGADVNRFDGITDSNCPLVARVNKRDGVPVSSMRASVNNRSETQQRRDLQHPGYNTPLMMATAKGWTKCVEVLVQGGADVNLLDGEGNSALMHATRWGHQQCVLALVNAGADMNAVNGRGRSAIITATRPGENVIVLSGELLSVESMVKLLIQQGADVNVADEFNSTALVYTVRRGFISCLKLLISAGADVNIGNPVITAARHSMDECVNMLLDAGADVNAIESAENVPLLFYVTSRCSLATLRHILKRGAMTYNNDATLRSSVVYYAHNVKQKTFYADTVMTLHAAGEMVHFDPKLIPINLKHLCREAIRHHLIELDPRENLFRRIPLLGLPPLLRDYLLYHCYQDTGSTSCDPIGHLYRSILGPI